MTTPPESPVPWPSDARLDPLVADWRIWQRRGGHRTSTDDLLTAWLAVHATGGRRPDRYLDLGCGIGSVMLMTAHALRPGLTTGVEAQAQSVAMARRTVEALPDAPAIRVVHADLRDVDPDALGGPFDLITGSPPYLPLGTGVVSDDPQRAACRFELRGGVEAYCAAARRCLAPGGLFSLVFQTAWDARVLTAASDAGLVLSVRADVRTRADRDAPFLSVYGFRRVEDAASELVAIDLAVRDAAGALTPDYRRVRSRLGLVPPG